MWTVKHVPKGRKRPTQKTFLTKPKMEHYVSRLRKQTAVETVRNTAWGVFRMRRYGGWSLQKLFDNPEGAKRMTEKMTAQFITVKWRKV